MKTRGKKPKIHPPECTCEQCYKKFCDINGLVWERQKRKEVENEQQ